MRKLLLSICCLGCALWAQAKDFTQYVNPLIKVIIILIQVENIQKS